jgi:hypothetical protein
MRAPFEGPFFLEKVMLEKIYFCWHEGQTEGDAKEVKAISMEEAAKMAVDIWRHERLKELGPNKVTVYVKDEEKHQKSFIISNQGDTRAPEAFH